VSHTNGPPADLIVPPGLSAGRTGDAAPDSLLGQLRATAAEKRQAKTLTLDMPGRWEGMLRVRYGVLGTDEAERQLAVGSNLTQSLEMLNRACRAIEAKDGKKWRPLEDDIGPVTFDDRLVRLLGWPRPGDEYRFSVRETYEIMFDVATDGIGPLGQHLRRVAEFMGVTEEEVAAVVGEASSRTSKPSAAPSPSA
jgi:hypothetical protein